MQNIINTIKYRVITTVIVVASVAISIVPSAVFADQIIGYGDAGYNTGYDYGSAGYNTGYDYGNSGYNTAYDYGSAGYNTGYDYGNAGYNTAYDYGSAGYNTAYDYGSAGYNTGYDYGNTGYNTAYANNASSLNNNYYFPTSSGYIGGYSMPSSYGGYGGYSGYSMGGGYNYGSNFGSSGCGSNCNTNRGCTQNCNQTPPPVVVNTQPLNGSCPTSGTYNLNQTVNWTANATGGNGTYTYTWSGDVTGSGSNVSSTYNTLGTKNANVVITSNGQSITRNCTVQIINNQTINTLNGYCVANVSNSQIGQTVTFNAYANGGNNNNYFYQWSGDVYGNGQSISQNFNSGGTKVATVQITDGSGQSVTRSCNVFVNNNYNNNNSNITLISNGTNTPTTGTLASGVFLSEIPYTGAAENIKMTLFVLGMTLWSAFMAWVVMKRKATKLGMTQREMIEKFKRENLAKKQITA